MSRLSEEVLLKTVSDTPLSPEEHSVYRTAVGNCCGWHGSEVTLLMRRKN